MPRWILITLAGLGFMIFVVVILSLVLVPGWRNDPPPQPHSTASQTVQGDFDLSGETNVAAGLTDHIWTVKELLTTLPLPNGINT